MQKISEEKVDDIKAVLYSGRRLLVWGDRGAYDLKVIRICNTAWLSKFVVCSICPAKCQRSETMHGSIHLLVANAGDASNGVCG